MHCRITSPSPGPASRQRFAPLGAALLALGVAACPTVGAGAQPQSFEAANPAALLVQMRCSTTGALPGDPGCGPMRAVRVGQDPGYRLNNGDFGSGRIDMVNVPIVRDGRWRVVSPDDHVMAAGASSQGGDSVEGVGPQYLSILGSWSPVATSYFVGSACATMPGSSQRFLDAWVLGPSHDTDTMEGAGLTYSGNLAGTSGASCPASYRAAAFTWEKRPFTYRWGRRLPSLVSVHYSAGSPPSLLGSAEQRERIYLAFGLGYARWEKWSRDDWSDPKSGRTSLEQAQSVFASGRCSTPIDDVTQDDGVQYGPVTTAGAYAEAIVPGPGQPSHVWYVTQCEDYTNLVLGPTRDLLQQAAQADDQFWR